MGLASVREDAGKQLENIVNYLNTFVTYCKTKDVTYQTCGVWIVGNLSPGSKMCNSRWAKRYNAIVENF